MIQACPCQIVDFTLHYTKLVFLKTEMIIQSKLRKSSYRGFWGFALLSTKSATTFGKLKFKFCVLKHKYRNMAGYWLKERRTWKLWRNDIANSRWRDVQSEQQSHARVIRTFVRLSDQILSNIFWKAMFTFGFRTAWICFPWLCPHWLKYLLLSRAPNHLTGRHFFTQHRTT